MAPKLPLADHSLHLLCSENVISPNHGSSQWFGKSILVSEQLMGVLELNAFWNDHDDNQITAKPAGRDISIVRVIRYANGSEMRNYSDNSA